MASQQDQDKTLPYFWQGQYGSVASYRDGQSHLWQNNREQLQEGQQQQFPQGNVSASGTSMRLFNGSSLSIQQTNYTGLSGYVNIYGNLCMEVRHALEIRNGSHLDVQENSHIRGSAFNWSRSENCGASGIYCRGKNGTIVIEAGTISTSTSTIEIVGGSAVQRSLKSPVPGHGIELWNGCDLYVGSPTNDHDNHDGNHDDNVVISAGSYVIDPPTKWMGKINRLPPSRLSSAISLWKSSATLYSGTYWGPEAVSLHQSNITIYGGSFYNRALGKDDQDNDGIAHKFDKEKYNGNTALKIEQGSTASIYGGHFHESFQDDISSCLEVSSYANVSIYGGSFQGSWSLWRKPRSWSDHDSLDVYGRNFRLVKDGKKHHDGTTISRRLKGTLCDGKDLSVRILTGVGVANVSKLFSFHSCTEQDYFDPALSAPRLFNPLHISLLMFMACIAGMGLVRHKRQWWFAAVEEDGNSSSRAVTKAAYSKVATCDIEMRVK